jgi:Tfp pilus assembly protein PilN
MRPVNLIPPEQRRGERVPTRTGPAAYALVAGLALALAAITALVLTSNQISDRKAEVAELEAEQAAARERADSLRPYAEFANLEQARVQTVTSLAESRFDWERAMRELALVIPEDIWLTTLTGTVRQDVSLETAAGGQTSLREGIAGPALEMSGCGRDHEAVAAFIAALEDIDGVTRVAVSRSERSDDTGSTGSTGGAGGAIDCELESAAAFDAVAAFDEVPVAEPVAAPDTPPVSAAASEETEGGVAEARAQEDQARGSIDNQGRRARSAADNLIPGTVR